MDKPVQPLKILFPHFVDAHNTGAQSLNVREIMLRLDPDRFACTAFYTQEPDARLIGCTHIRLVKIPSRMGSLVMLREAFRGHDILFSPTVTARFTRLFLLLPTRHLPIVLWLEGVIKGNLNNRRLERQFQRLSGRTDTHVAITETVAATSRRDYAIDVQQIIPVGIDMAVFTVGQHKRDIRGVVYVGHLVERKNPRLVLEAARRFPGVMFTLVGAVRDAEYGDLLYRYVADHDLTNVVFLPPMLQNELNRVFNENDVLVLPSRVEGLPKVTLEAAAAGMPCVIFDDYHTPSVVDGVTGFQVQTEEQFFARLGQLIAEPALRLRMGQAAVEHVRQFSWDTVARQWEAVFQSVAERQGRS